MSSARDIYIYIYRSSGVVRRPLDLPPKREIGFVSFVRASEAVCLRERDYASLRWPCNSQILLRLRFVPFLRLWRVVFCMGFKETLTYSLIYAWVLCLLLIFSCVLHGFCHFVDI